MKAPSGPIKVFADDSTFTTNAEDILAPTVHEGLGGRDGIALVTANWHAGHVANKPAGSSTETTRLPIYRIQVASFRDDSESAKLVDLKALDQIEVVQGLETVVERANVADATFYRVQAGSFQSRLKAEAVCDGLRRRDTACVVVRR